MKPENLKVALQICAEHHSSKLSINHLRHDSSQVSDAIPLVIHECCASVINKLIDCKFTLSMGKEGLHVSDYCK
jgi:hypothetical protein